MGRHAVGRRHEIPGLTKRCRHIEWNRCACTWYARYRHVDKTSLNFWTGRELPTRALAAQAFEAFKQAVRDGTLAPRQAKPVGETFSAAVADYRREHVAGLHDKSIGYALTVLEGEFGTEAVVALSQLSHLEWKRRLDTIAVKRRWSARTWNLYFKYLSGLWGWIISAEAYGVTRNPCAKNPVFRLDRQAEAAVRETRVPVEAEQKMIALCVERDGDPLVPSGGAHRTTGREMLRRLYAAIDCGLRKEEMLQIQLSMLTFGVVFPLSNGTELHAIKIVLPPSITKGGKTSGLPETVWAVTPRLIGVLNARRFVGADGYVFGDEDGHYVGSFAKSWHTLYEHAGLVPGQDVGQHCWHDLRHEFASYLVEQGASGDEVMRLCRHRDYDTTRRYLAARDSTLAETAAIMGRR
jgi:integrase